MIRIHIVGSGPRTGTTLLTEVMAACFNIDNVCEHEAAIGAPLPLKGNFYLTKNPSDINSVRLPLLINPNLYVLCMIRDPRDTVVSFHGAVPDKYYTGLRSWKLFVKKFDALNKHPRFIPIKYEHLVSNPDIVQNDIESKIPFLRAKHRFSEFHKVANPSISSLNALKGLRKIEPKGIGKWKNHLARVKQQITIHGSISNDLIKFHYENDKKWEKILDGIEIINYKSNSPELYKRSEIISDRRREFYAVANIVIWNLGFNPAPLFKLLKTILKKNKGHD